jgi:hypothetical protein
VRERGGCYEITFNFTWLARWLDAHVGTDASTKKIPMIAFDLPEAETTALVRGIQEGDGSESEYANRIQSSSQTLLRQIQVILTKTERYGNIIWSVERKEGYIAYGGEVRTRHWMDSEAIYTPVISTTHTRFDGKVYNIETSDHNYCTPIVVHNSQTRDFNYVSNIVDGIMKAIHKVGQGDGYQVWNIGSGEETSIRQLVESIINISRSSSKIVTKPSRPGEEGRLCMSIEKAKSELGYSPKVSLDGGLSKTISWMKTEASTS